MASWRFLALLLAVLAFLLAAGGSPDGAPGWPIPGALRSGLGRMPFFWLGVLCFLAAVWGRGGG